MSGGHFTSYVDIFNTNEYLEPGTVGTNHIFQSESFEYVSKDDIVEKHQNVPTVCSAVRNESGSETCPTAYDLVPIENSMPGNSISSDNHSEATERLCGYLKVHKTTDINRSRRRWFVFTDENCRLLYFKTPQDMIPRCDIDVANSSFYIQVSDKGCSNKFEIRCKDNIYILEAPNQKTMFYWLQELQKHRRHYSVRKAKSLPHKLSVPEHMEQPCAVDDPSPAPVLENVSLPRDTIGDHTKHNTAPAASFVHLREELRKVLTNIVNKRDSASAASSGLLQNIRTKVYERRGIKTGQSLRTSDDFETPCNRCSLNQEQMTSYKDEMSQMEEELQATREVTWILQKQLDELASQARLRSKLEITCDQQNVIKTLLEDQEKKIVDLEYLLTATQEEKEILNSNNRTLEAEVASLKEQIAAFKDSLEAKDSVVMSLAKQLQDNKSRIHEGQAVKSTQSTIERETTKTEIQQLQDMVEGYKFQNKFLNQEILELTKLRQDSNSMVQEMLQTCLKLETNYYDVHRKYVACLKELGKVQAEEESASSVELLQRLLQDAVLSSSRSRDSQAGVPTGNLVSFDGAMPLPKYDELGFQVTEANLNSSYDDTIDSIEKQSDEHYIKAKSIEFNLSVSIEWERFLANVDFSRVDKSKELKELIRTGVPNVHRGKLWKRCVELVVGRTRAGFGANYYNNLIETLKLSPYQLSPAAKQIELDLLRTLPGNKNYECIYSGNVPKLRRVLLAYSHHDPITGYCQGFNRLAAIALLFLEEEDAFWCLMAVINFLLPHNYYCSGMQGAHMDQRVLVDLVQEKLPVLYNHFKALNVDLTLFTFNWFLTIFVDNIPTQTYLRIWDSFLYEGSKVLFRYSLAFLKYKEKDILGVKESGDLYMYMRKLAEKMIDINTISQIAFKDLNPFPLKHIQARRQHHLVAVKAELAKLEEMRGRMSRVPSES